MSERPWFADVANFKAAGIIPKDLNWQQRKKFLHDARFYIWDDPHLFKIGAGNILRRCVTQEEVKRILWHCHNSSCGGHYGGDKTTTKVLQSKFFLVHNIQVEHSPCCLKHVNNKLLPRPWLHLSTKSIKIQKKVC